MSFYRDFNDKLAIERWNTRKREPFESFEITPLAPTLGAEVHGLDLREDLTDAQFVELRRALAENLVLVFRDQEISPAQHKRLGLRFGRLHQHVLASSKVVAGQSFDPDLLAWRTGKGTRFTPGDNWHHDVSCDKEPIIASFLHVAKSPAFGAGDTAFANAYLAYDSLSEPIKELIDNLTAIHDGNQGWAAGYGAKPAPGTHYPENEHPIAPRHPWTGRRLLYVNQSFTSHIPQLTRPESDALLGFLYRHVASNLSFQVRVHWTSNTLVAWDNWATQHHAVWDYYPLERWGTRVSAINGSPSTGDALPIAAE